MNPPLHPAIRRTLAGFRQRVLVLRGLTALGTIALVAGTTFSLALAGDRYFLLPEPLRPFVTFLALLAPAGVVLWKLSSLFRSLGALSVARAMEQLSPDLDESVISTVQLTRADSPERPSVSRDLLQALQDSTAEQLRRLRPKTRLTARPAAVSLMLGASIWIVIGALFLVFPRSLDQLAERFLHPSTPLPRPSTTELEIRPGNTILATGTEVRISAELRRGNPGSGVLVWHREGDEAPREAVLPFRREGDSVTLTRTFPPLDTALEYRLTAGDFQSPWYRIEVRNPPEPRQFNLTFHYPDYTRFPDLTRNVSSGAISVLEGTSVSIVLEASEPLASAAIRLVERTPSRVRPAESLLPLRVHGRKAVLERLLVSSTLTGYELRLVGRDGVHNSGRARYPIEVRPDRAPNIDLVSPRGAEISVEPTSRVDLEYRARDDVGLARVLLVLRPDTEEQSIFTVSSLLDPPERTVSLKPASHAPRTPDEPAPRTIETTYGFDVACLSLEAGAAVPFVLEAIDIAGQSTRTSPRQLRAIFNPLYPEGPDWPHRLSEVGKQIESILLDWKQLGPFAEDDMSSSVTVDAAMIESMDRRAGNTVDILTRMGRSADRITELARSIAVASPQRRTLELIARHLRTVGLRSGADFWTGLHEILARGRERPSSPTARETGSAAMTFERSFEDLTRLYRATGSVLETCWSDFRAVLQSEIVEEALEHTRALARNQQSVVDSWRRRREPAPATRSPKDSSAGRLVERQQGLLRQATRIGARLAALAQNQPRSDARLEALGRAYLQNTVVPLESVRRALAGDEPPDGSVPPRPAPGDGVSLPPSPPAEDEVEAAAKAALTRLSWSVQDLADMRRRLQGQVDSVRESLESDDPIGRDLKTVLELMERATEDEAPELAGNEALASILRLLDDLIVEVEEELDTVESMAYADLETVTDLSSILKIFEEVRRDVLLSGREDYFPEEDSELLLAQGALLGPGQSMSRKELSAVRGRMRKVFEAYSVTAPSRRLGRAIQDLDLVASSGEELVSRLRGAEPWKLREIRFHVRALEEIRGALECATKLLTGLRDAADLNPSQERILSSGLGTPLADLDRAAAHMQEVVEQLAFSLSTNTGQKSDASEDPAARLLAGRNEARRAVLKVDEAILHVENLRKAVLTNDSAGAAAARRWLREQRGALAVRVHRLAEREADHAERVKTTSRELSTGGGRPGSQLLVEHEELRRATRELAEQARREADAVLGEGAGLEHAKRYDRAARRLLAIAEGEMLDASRALRRAEEAPDGEARGFYLEASTQEDRATQRLRDLARALRTLEGDDALEDLSTQLDELLGSAPDDGRENRTIEEILAEARLLLAKSRETTTVLAARLRESPRYRPVVEALRIATEHLQAAVRAAEDGAREPAGRALARGREKLREAAALAREIRGEQRELVQNASESLAPEPRPEKKDTPKSKELEALRKEVEDMLAKLQATQALQKEIDALFRDILGADSGDPEGIDPDEAERLQEEEERLLDEFNERFMTLDQLVTLIAKLLEIEKDSGVLRGEQDRLARDFLEVSGRDANRARGLEETAGEQKQLSERGKQLIDRFTKSGFRLTASLPQVMTSYWRAGDAAGRVLESQLKAQTRLETHASHGTLTETESRETAGSLFDVGKSIETFLGRLRETRQLALQAITEEESGIDSSSLGQRQIETSRSALSEALEMLRRGNLKEAQAAHRQSMRSLAQATRSIRKGTEFDFFSEATLGDFNRALDPTADFEWKVLTRGDESLEELKFNRDGVVELPYPTQFRELVRIYLKALAARRM